VYATMLRMAIARIAAISLALCVCTALAQKPVMGTLAVTVTDQTGARIAGAHIMATSETTGVHYVATADSSGQAVIHVDQEKYELKVQAEGFKTLVVNNVNVKAEIQRTITLQISEGTCEPCFIVEGPEIPLEYQSLAAEIPLMSMQKFELTARPIHRKQRRF